VHRGLAGVEEVSGREYTVEDGDLLRWVHCCLVDSFLSIYQRSGGGLTGTQCDGYVAEQSRLAPLVGLSVDDVPTTAAGLIGYFRDIRPQLRASPDAFAAARLVVWPPMSARLQLLTPARPTWTAIGALAFASLPRWARQLYRMPGLAVTDVAATIGLRTLAPVLHRLPAAYREGPHLRAANQRLAESPRRHLRAVQAD
jgi:uncharacterized protein (DUF2236 family)